MTTEVDLYIHNTTLKLIMEKISSLLDRYEREARFYPTMISLFPLWILTFYLLKDFLTLNQILNFIASLTVYNFIGAYLFTDIIRNLGKGLESRIFKDELSFPSTDLLINSKGGLSKETRDKIFKKIENDFGIALPTNKINKNNRKRISEAIGLIRNRVFKGKLLLNYNIRYGFWRNLIASFPISIIINALAIYYFSFVHKEYYLTYIFISVIFVFVMLFLFRKRILCKFGKEYSKQLFIEYLAN